MDPGPGWVPDIDVEAAASVIGDGLQRVVGGLPQAAGALATAEPTTLVLGTIVGTLAEEKIVVYGRKLDLRLEEYIEEHEGDENSHLVKVAAGVSRLLPDGHELTSAALDAARGDPEALREQLRKYHENEDLRADLDDAVQRVLTGEFDDLDATLTDAFDTTNVEAAQALLFDFIEIIRTRQIQQILEEVLALDGRFDDLKADLDQMQQELEHNIKQGLIEAALRDEGFRRLSPLTFDRDIADPERPWRAGFEFIHVREGFAVDRQSQDGTNVTHELFAALRSAEPGTSRIVRAPAGSGKSTICRQVACR